MNSLSQEVLIIIISCIFFIIVAVGIIVLILVYQKKQLLYRMEKNDLQNQFQRELLKTRLETQEQTFNHISRELHDNIGQLLNSGAVLVATAQRTSGDGDSLQMARETLVKAVQEVRTLSKSLDQQWLEQFSLFENLQAEAARLNASREFTMSVSHPDEISLAPDKQLVLFRMIQEAFQNSLRHGKAEHVTIDVKQEADYFQVRVQDDGQGFSPDDVSRHGLGMNNIKNRASLMGGSALWQSGNNGTLVEIKVPLK